MIKNNKNTNKIITVVIVKTSLKQLLDIYHKEKTCNIKSQHQKSKRWYQDDMQNFEEKIYHK